MSTLPLALDKDVPMPRRCPPWKYNWLAMQVGDSFLVTDVSADAVRSAAWNAGKRYGGRFATRREPSGTRVFRVE